MTKKKTKKTTASSTRKPFDYSAAIATAGRIFAAPPARDFIKRPELLPTVVFRAAFPAEICKEANATSRRAFAKNPWAHADLKKRVWKLMEEQAKPWLKYRWAWPLKLESGRPQVVAVKFSSHPNDEGSNPAKAPIDMLTCHKWLNKRELKRTKHRIGIIADDRRSTVDQLHWWEPLPRDQRAFVLIEVRI